MADNIDKFLADYEKISVKMLGATSIQEAMLKSIDELFDDFSIDNQSKAQVLTEIAVQTATAYNKDAIAAAMEVIKLDFESDVKVAQVKLIERQEQGFDDNMLLKIVEHQASLASFAVNAGSDTAQVTIDSLKDKMLAVEQRVQSIDGEANCPLPPRITPVPQNLIAANITDTVIELSWSSVVGATSYLLYKDGVLIATQGGLTFVDSELSFETKYAYSVKASIDGIDSDFSQTIVPTTLSEIV